MNHLTIDGDKNLEGKKWVIIGEQNLPHKITLEQIQDDEIKVGDRVVCLKDNRWDITEGMIYRASDLSNDNINIIDDSCGDGWYPKFLFTKLQKPKEGDGHYRLGNDGKIWEQSWEDSISDNNVWDFGFGFHTESQAKFCRDRIRRVI